MILSRLAAALTALAIMLLVAACAGVRSSSEAAPESGVSAAATGPRSVGPGHVRLVISRDYGTHVIHDQTLPLGERTTVMQVLASAAKVETAYGGGFVHSIAGISSSFGAANSPSDWFYWVDGVMAQVGALDYALSGGETVWWDYHSWDGSGSIPVVLQAFPAPWSRAPVEIVAESCSDEAAGWASTLEGGAVRRAPLDRVPCGSAVIAATIAEAEQQAWLSALLDSGEREGVYVSLRDGDLRAVDARGATRGPLVGAAVALAHPTDSDASLLVLLARDRSALVDLLSHLPDDLPQACVSLGLQEDGELTQLPATSASSEGT